MIRLGWKEKLHVFTGGRLLGTEYHAEEGFVTQCLEMGRHKPADDVWRLIERFYLVP